MRYGFIRKHSCINVGFFETEEAVKEIRNVFIPNQYEEIVICPDNFGIGDNYIDDVWVKVEKEPSIEQKYEQLSGENKLLKAQLQAQTDRSDFIEECIAEMATQVYV